MSYIIYLFRISNCSCSLIRCFERVQINNLQICCYQYKISQCLYAVNIGLNLNEKIYAPIPTVKMNLCSAS